MKNYFLLISLFIFISFNLSAQQNEENEFNDKPTQSNIYFTQTDVRTLADRNLNSVISLYSGVDFFRNNLFIHGSFPEANVYMIDGIPFNSYDKDAAFHLPFQTWENISLAKGSSNAQFGYGENFIFQNIKTASDKLVFNIEYLTDNISFKSKGDAFDGQKRFGSHWFGYSNFNASLSAPIYKDQIKFFGNISYRFERDKNPQNYPGIDIGKVNDLSSGDSISLQYPAGSLLNNSLENINYTGKLFFDFEPVQFTLSGHYSDQTQYDPFQSGIITNFLNPFRTEEENIKKWFINAGFTHKVSESISYSINGSFSSFQKKEYDPILKDNFLGYGDSLENANAGLFEEYNVTPWRGSYTPPSDRILFGFGFNEPGSVVANYAKLSDQRLYLSENINFVLFKNHFFSAGVEYDKHTIRKFNLSNSNLVGLPGYIASVNALPDVNTKPSMEEIFIGRGFNNIGYDFYDNDTDGPNEQDYFGAPEPNIISFFVQDKFTYGNFSFSLGGRIDNFDFESWRLRTPEMPEESINRNTGEILDGGFIQSSESHLKFSPRFSTSYNFNNDLSVSFSAGKYYYSPNLHSLYAGAYAITHQLRQNFIFGVDGFIASEVKPVSSTYYELSGVYYLSHIGMASLSLFYKDLQSIPVFANQLTDNTSAFQDYFVHKQIGSLIARGIELDFISNRMFGLKVHGAFSFQNENKFDKYICFKSNLIFDYKSGRNENILLDRFGISLQTIFNDGRIVFRRNSFFGELEGEGRTRQPINFDEDKFLPSFVQINLKIDKTFSISSLVDINLYLDIINLFDANNVLEIFDRTGNAIDDGYLSDPNLGGQLIETYGPVYAEVYNAINNNYKDETLAMYNQQYGSEVFYGPPRQIRFGVRLEY